jgi:hypothetical protein
MFVEQLAHALFFAFFGENKIKLKATALPPGQLFEKLPATIFLYLQASRRQEAFFRIGAMVH